MPACDTKISEFLNGGQVFCNLGSFAGDISDCSEDLWGIYHIELGSGSPMVLHLHFMVLLCLALKPKLRSQQMFVNLPGLGLSPLRCPLGTEPLGDSTPAVRG